jgi:predicted nucleic acid-binding protein
MPDKVIDASVAAAIAFAEPRANEAGELIEGSTLHAPSLLPYELCNAARRKSSRDPRQAKFIASGLRTALAANVDLVAVPAAELLALALETGLTAYDASYLWVAKSLGCELLTFDEQLARAARAAQA